MTPVSSYLELSSPHGLLYGTLSIDETVDDCFSPSCSLNGAPLPAPAPAPDAPAATASVSTATASTSASAAPAPKPHSKPLPPPPVLLTGQLQQQPVHPTCNPTPPTAWFACDDDVTKVRYFVIQGSSSMDHWQINFSFDPVVFAEPSLGVRIHRGVYVVRGRGGGCL